MNFPPACLFPTTTVILDDDDDFLTTLQKRLQLPAHLVRCFSNPNQANKFLLQTTSRCWNTDWISTSPSENSYDNLTVEIQIPKIANAIRDPHRFARVTTIIVDYKMPGLNGLEFLESLTEIPAKKILLTNVADTDIAIDAMEKGLIDRLQDKNIFQPK